MVRFLYVRLLRMHPLAFRESFGAEMLWIFDKEAQLEAQSALLVDCFVSLFRQWIVRSGFPKIMLAFAVASIQFLFASLIWRLPKIAPCSPHASTSTDRGNSMGLLAIALGIATIALVAVLAFWARHRAASTPDQIA